MSGRGHAVHRMSGRIPLYLHLANRRRSTPAAANTPVPSSNMLLGSGTSESVVRSSAAKSSSSNPSVQAQSPLAFKTILSAEPLWKKSATGSVPMNTPWTIGELNSAPKTSRPLLQLHGKPHCPPEGWEHTAIRCHTPGWVLQRTRTARHQGKSGNKDRTSPTGHAESETTTVPAPSIP